MMIKSLAVAPLLFVPFVAEASPTLIYPLKAAEICEEARQTMGPYTDYADPNGRIFLVGRETYARHHAKYAAAAAGLERKRGSLLLGEEMGADLLASFIESCSKRGPDWTRLNRILPASLKGMEDYSRLLSTIRGFNKERKIREAMEEAVIESDFRALLAKGAIAEVLIETHYIVEIAYSVRTVSTDPGQLLRDLAKTRFRQVMVDERTYNRWREGQILDVGGNPLGWLLLDDSARITTARVSRKLTMQEAVLKLKSGHVDRISTNQVPVIHRALEGAGLHLLESSLMGQRTFLVLENEPRAEDFVEVVPLERHYVTLLMRNVRPLSFELRDLVNEWSLAVKFEYEVTTAVHRQRSVDVRERRIEGIDYLVDGTLSFTAMDVVSRRSEIDNDHVLAKTRQGTSVIMTRAQYESLP